MTNTLPKSVRFNNTDITIIDRNGQPWITGVQIASALGMADRRGVHMLWTRHKDEFSTNMTAVIRDGRTQRRIYSIRGARLIAMLAKTPPAKSFRRDVLDVLETVAKNATTEKPVTVRKHQRALPAPKPERPISEEKERSMLCAMNSLEDCAKKLREWCGLTLVVGWTPRMSMEINKARTALDVLNDVEVGQSERFAFPNKKGFPICG